MDIILPDQEMHELGLLYMHYYARLLGKKTIYLGQSVPFDDLEQICSSIQVEGIISFFTTNPDPKVIPEYLQQLSKLLNKNNANASAIIGGFMLQKVPNPPQLENITLVNGLKEVKSTFSNLQKQIHAQYDRSRSTSTRI